MIKGIKALGIRVFLFVTTVFVIFITLPNSTMGADKEELRFCVVQNISGDGRTVIGARQSELFADKDAITKPFYWRNGTVHFLSTKGAPQAKVIDSSEDGEVIVGYIQTSDKDTFAVKWNHGALEKHQEPSYDYSYAQGVSHDGQATLIVAEKKKKVSLLSWGEKRFNTQHLPNYRFIYVSDVSGDGASFVGTYQKKSNFQNLPFIYFKNNFTAIKASVSENIVPKSISYDGTVVAGKYFNTKTKDSGAFLFEDGVMKKWPMSGHFGNVKISGDGNTLVINLFDVKGEEKVRDGVYVLRRSTGWEKENILDLLDTRDWGIGGIVGISDDGLRIVGNGEKIGAHVAFLLELSQNGAQPSVQEICSEKGM